MNCNAIKKLLINKGKQRGKKSKLYIDNSQSIALK